MRISVTISPPVPVIPPEIEGRRAFLLHDFQTAETNYSIFRSYLPETEKFGVAAFEIMQVERQKFWFGLLGFYAGGTKTEVQLRSIWSGLTAGNKAFCNKHGGTQNPRSDVLYLDYINNTGNVDTPMAQESLTTCGNMIILTGGSRNIGGVPYVGFWCLDSLAAMPFGIEDSPLLDYFIHAATTITPDPGTQPNFPRHSIAPNGTFICNNFPNLDGRKIPVPVFSAIGAASEVMGIRVRENWLRADRVCKLDNDEFPSPMVR